METERKFYFIEDIAKVYPELEKWFIDPEHISAQLQGDKRLLSAREKLHLFGGKKQIKDNIGRLPEKLRDLYMVLLSSRISPMVLTEIALFYEMVGITRDNKALAREAFNAGKRPLRTGELTLVGDLTYIIRLANDPNIAILSTGREGYLTTDKGLNVNAENLQQIKKSRFSIRQLIPNLN